MEAALAKIRPHKNSGLAHQKTPATLLAALESTLDDQKTERSPVAYFAALLTTLEATIQKNDTGLEDGDVLPAELYLLALVAPFVPVSVVRTHLSIILSLTSPLFPALESHAPALRSQITLYHTLFSSLDRSQSDVQGIRQTFASILQLCVDKRPKVRRKAAEVVESVLSNPPAPLNQHPYAERVAAWVDSVLEHVNGNVFGKSKSSNDPADTAIHLLAFLRPVLLLLPPSALPQITASILNLPRFGNPYLSQSAYATLSDVFLTASADPTNPISSHISDVLNAILASPPLQTDNILSPAWVKVVGNALLAYSKVDGPSSDRELFRVWKIVWTYLESTHSPTRNAAVESLQTLTQCFSESLLESATTNTSSTVPKIVSHATKALDSLTYARAFPEMLAVFSSLFVSVVPHAPSLLVPAVEKVGALRTQKSFEFKEDADRALTTAMQSFGPQALLQILPLNLEPADRDAGKEPRAYLLPMLAHPHTSSAKHFVTYFVPLSERLFDLQQKAETEGRQSEAKVWAVLVSQIWAGLPCYNWATTELPEVRVTNCAHSVPAVSNFTQHRLSTKDFLSFYHSCSTGNLNYVLLY
jgi:ribosomal RNA-processing protein 12